MVSVAEAKQPRPPSDSLRSVASQVLTEGESASDSFFFCAIGDAALIFGVGGIDLGGNGFRGKRRANPA